MVITTSQAEEIKNGNISKTTLLKIWNTYDFENYLFRYAKIIKDKREELYRYTTFLIHGIEITTEMHKGECISISKR